MTKKKVETKAKETSPKEAVVTKDIKVEVTDNNKKAETKEVVEKQVKEQPKASEVFSKSDDKGKDKGLSDNIVNKEPAKEKPPIELKFRSDSEEARYYILDMLKHGESRKKKDIVAYIEECSGKRFSDATIINVLRGMVSNGSLMQLERGTYSIGSGVGLVSKLISFVDTTRKNLEKISTVSVSDIKDSDISAIDEVKKLKETLNNIYEKLVII